MRYSQALRLNRICSGNTNFDKRCNNLEKWLMGRGYNEKMVRNQILRTREHSRNDLLEREKQQMSEQKLKFNIIYYPAVQNVRAIIEELHILLTTNKEHKKVFPNVSVIRFWNGKSLKEFIVRPTLPKTNGSGRCEPCGKKTGLVCDSISTATTFTTEACQETFKIQSDPLTCNSKKVPKKYLLNCKVCGEIPHVGKAKTKFRYRFNNYKSKPRAFRKGNRKVPQKLFHTQDCLDGHSSIEDSYFVIFQQYERHAQLKERETFWQHRLKIFYSICLNEKQEYLY